MSPATRSILVLLLILAVPAGADVVRILDDPLESLQARTDLIQQAERDIALMVFLARDDEVTLGVLALLRDARRRGVEDVRVLLDGSFHRIPKAVLAHLRDEGVRVRVYHPLDLRHPSWMIRRMHEKLVVADGARYITGGRNLGESYFGLAKRGYVDRDVWVEGVSAAQARAHFETVWNSRHVADLRVRVTRLEKQRAAERIGGVLAGLVQRGVVRLDTGTDWAAGLADAGEVRLLVDPLPRGPGPRVGVRLAEILDAAETSILIESPYFVPPKSLRTLLERKLDQGVRVTIVTNSLRSTDGLLPQVAYLRYRGDLVRDGVDVREFKGPDTLHAKSVVVDDRIALVGSYNIDPRSRYLNSELLCVVEDERVARRLRASIEAHIEHSWAMGSAPDEAPRVTRAMSLRIWAARLVVPLIEPQL